LVAVEGNLVLDATGGSIEATAEGNVKVQATLAPGQQCTIRAEGDITCEVPRDAGGVFVLKAEGHIRVRDLGEERSVRNGVLNFERAPAHARLTLEAEGNILLRGAQPRDLDAAEFAGTLEEEMALRSVEITQQISAQIEAQVNELSRQLDDKLSRIGTNEELATSIQEKVQFGHAPRRGEAGRGAAQSRAAHAGGGEPAPQVAGMGGAARTTHAARCPKTARVAQAQAHADHRRGADVDPAHGRTGQTFSRAGRETAIGAERRQTRAIEHRACFVLGVTQSVS
jgi:hypothetical protein